MNVGQIVRYEWHGEVIDGTIVEIKGDVVSVV